MQKQISEEGHLIEVDVLNKKSIIEEGTCPHYRSKKNFLVKKIIDHYNEEHIKKTRLDLFYRYII